MRSEYISSILTSPNHADIQLQYRVSAHALVTRDVVGLLGVYSRNAHHKIGSKSQCELLLQTN